ncbi:MAG: acyloxyacyl hydrolase [Phycisphaerales bacterium]|nr:acyloxyacyl hydrolase [Phycisphaerales bacterium]
MFLETTLLLSSCFTTALPFSVDQEAPTLSLHRQLMEQQDGLMEDISSALEAELRISPAAFEDTEDTKTTASFGSEGSQRWALMGGWGIDVKHSSNNEMTFGAKWEYFIADGFAFAPELKMWGFFQEGEDAFGVSLDLLFEWHFIRHDTWSIYGDAGVGILGSTKNVPIDGSEFNFTPQAGLGICWDVGEGNRWFVGVRWHHISNASLYSNNPGRDSILVYTGLNMPF